MRGMARRPVLAVLLSLVVAGCAAGESSPSATQSQAASPSPPSSAPPATLPASPSASPTLIPTTVPTPSPSLVATGFLPYGDWATVTAENLRVRTGPSLAADIRTVLQPGDRLFLVGGGAENDEDNQYIWYFVAYRAAVDKDDQVVAEGQGWLAGATFSPGGVDSEWFMEWDEHRCPPTVDQATLERLTDWAKAACTP